MFLMTVLHKDVMSDQKENKSSLFSRVPCILERRKAFKSEKLDGDIGER